MQQWGTFQVEHTSILTTNCQFWGSQGETLLAKYHTDPTTVQWRPLLSKYQDWICFWDAAETLCFMQHLTAKNISPSQQNQVKWTPQWVSVLWTPCISQCSMLSLTKIHCGICGVLFYIVLPKCITIETLYATTTDIKNSENFLCSFMKKVLWLYHSDIVLILCCYMITVKLTPELNPEAMVLLYPQWLDGNSIVHFFAVYWRTPDKFIQETMVYFCERGSIIYKKYSITVLSKFQMLPRYPAQRW